MTTITQDMANDYLNWVDPESVTLVLRRSGGNTTISVASAIRHAVTDREAAASGGRVRMSDMVFHLPVALVNASPNGSKMIEPGDTITITADVGEPVQWIVQEARLAYRNNKWRCVCRRNANYVVPP